MGWQFYNFQLLWSFSVMNLDAVKTYYNSMANVRRLKASGKYKEKVVKQRKNRISNVSSTTWRMWYYVTIHDKPTYITLAPNLRNKLPMMMIYSFHFWHLLMLLGHYTYLSNLCTDKCRNTCLPFYWSDGCCSHSRSFTLLAGLHTLHKQRLYIFLSANTYM